MLLPAALVPAPVLIVCWCQMLEAGQPRCFTDPRIESSWWENLKPEQHKFSQPLAQGLSHVARSSENFFQLGGIGTVAKCKPCSRLAPETCKSWIYTGKQHNSSNHVVQPPNNTVSLPSSVHTQFCGFTVCTLTALNFMAGSAHFVKGRTRSTLRVGSDEQVLARHHVKRGGCPQSDLALYRRENGNGNHTENGDMAHSPPDDSKSATWRLHEGVSTASRAENLQDLHRLQKSATKPRAGAWVI